MCAQNFEPWNWSSHSASWSFLVSCSFGSTQTQAPLSPHCPSLNSSIVVMQGLEQLAVLGVGFIAEGKTDFGRVGKYLANMAIFCQNLGLGNSWSLLRRSGNSLGHYWDIAVGRIVKQLAHLCPSFLWTSTSHCHRFSSPWYLLF